MMHDAINRQCSAHMDRHVHARTPHPHPTPSLIPRGTYVKRAQLAARACGQPFVLLHHAAAPLLQPQGSVSKRDRHQTSASAGSVRALALRAGLVSKRAHVSAPVEGNFRRDESIEVQSRSHQRAR